MLNSYLILLAFLSSDFVMSQMILGHENNARQWGDDAVRKYGKKGGKKSGGNFWKGIVVGGRTRSSDFEIVSCNPTSVEIRGPRCAFISKGMLLVALGDGSNKDCDNCSPLFRQVTSIMTTSAGTKILTTSHATMEMLFGSYIFDSHLLKTELLESRLGSNCIANRGPICDEVKESGYFSDTTQPFTIDLGRSNGIFLLTYDMYDEPNTLYIDYEGARIFETNGNVRGKNATYVKYSGESTIITVFIDTFSEGAQWTFFVGCAELL